jgi:hypothetical protein
MRTFVNQSLARQIKDNQCVMIFHNHVRLGSHYQIYKPLFSLSMSMMGKVVVQSVFTCVTESRSNSLWPFRTFRSICDLGRRFSPRLHNCWTQIRIQTGELSLVQESGLSWLSLATGVPVRGNVQNDGTILFICPFLLCAMELVMPMRQNIGSLSPIPRLGKCQR